LFNGQPADPPFRLAPPRRNAGNDVANFSVSNQRRSDRENAGLIADAEGTEAAMSSQERTQRHAMSAEGRTVANQPNVLVVDDDMFLRLEVDYALARAGFTVLSASDAHAAEKLLQERPEIALLVTDVQMPGSMDSVTLARSVLSQRPEIRVIMMSAFWAGRRFVPRPCGATEAVPARHGDPTRAPPAATVILGREAEPGR
jgi:response regulator receiver domain-containing protein